MVEKVRICAMVEQDINAVIMQEMNEDKNAYCVDVKEIEGGSKALILFETTTDEGNVPVVMSEPEETEEQPEAGAPGNAGTYRPRKARSE